MLIRLIEFLSAQNNYRFLHFFGAYYEKQIIINKREIDYLRINEYNE